MQLVALSVPPPPSAQPQHTPLSAHTPPTSTSTNPHAIWILGCGANSQTVAHVIQRCQRFAYAQATNVTPVATRPTSPSTLFDNKEGEKAILNFPEVTESWFKPRLEAYAPAQGMSCNPILIPICRVIPNLFCSTLTECVAYFRGSSSFFGISFVYGCFRTGCTYCTPRIWCVAWQQLLVPWTLAFIQPIDRALPLRSTWQDASALVTGVDFYVCKFLA